MPSFPVEARLKGSRNSAPVHVAMADEFYAPILPIMLDLRSQGLSLRAIANELVQCGIKARYGCERWSAAQAFDQTRDEAVTMMLQLPDRHVVCQPSFGIESDQTNKIVVNVVWHVLIS